MDCVLCFVTKIPHTGARPLQGEAFQDGLNELTIERDKIHFLTTIAK